MMNDRRPEPDDQFGEVNERSVNDRHDELEYIGRDDYLQHCAGLICARKRCKAEYRAIDDL